MAQKARRDIKICFWGDITNIHLQRWVRSITDCGYTTRVISWRNGKLNDIPVYVINFEKLIDGPFTSYFDKLKCLMKVILLARKHLRIIKPDITHVHYLRNDLSLIALLGLNNIFLSPWGNDIICDDNTEPVRNIILKKILLNIAQKVTASSEFLARAITKYSKVKVEIIYFGIERKFFEKKQIKESKYINISFIKHLEPKYGPEYLIESIPLLVKGYKNVFFNIIGQGSLEIALKKRVEELQIQDYIQFYGKLEHSKVIDILTHTHIFVMPSVYQSESFGVAAAEASAMGIPVIASNVGGVPEVIIDGYNGILIPPRDHKAIAKACTYLIDNPAVMEKMGLNGQSHIKHKFAWEKSVHKMDCIYQQFINGA